MFDFRLKKDQTNRRRVLPKILQKAQNEENLRSSFELEPIPENQKAHISHLIYKPSLNGSFLNANNNSREKMIGNS